MVDRKGLCDTCHLKGRLFSPHALIKLTPSQPIDFTRLKPQTREFLKEMLIQLLIASQRSAPLVTSNFNEVVLTRNRSVVEEIFIKAARIENLATGLVYFITEAFRDLSMKEEGLSKFLEWAVVLARQTLQSKMNGIPTQ
jgi:nucleolar MIF4G domain-containing protein 1